MEIQRLRNLTTGRLHTKMQDIYEDIKYIVGEKGIMSHMIPDAHRAMLPYLKAKVLDSRFWDDAYDPSHEGEFEILPMNEQEQKEFWNRYSG